MPGQRGVDEGGMLGDMSNAGSWGVQGEVGPEVCSGHHGKAT